MDPDPLRRYERLDIISNIFEAFPPYWYYKANAAREVAESDKYKEIPEIKNKYLELAFIDYKKFEEIYTTDNELMREDVIAASSFLEYINLIAKFPEKYDKNKIIELLSRAERLAGNTNFDILQQCVFHYISLSNLDNINDYSSATRILRHLINENYNLSLNGRLLSRIYCKKLNDRISYDVLEDRIGTNNVFPWEDRDVDENRIYLQETFNNFMQLFMRKYEIMFNKLIPYNFSNGKEAEEFYYNENIQLRKYNIENIFSNEPMKNNFICRLNILIPYIDLSNELFNKLYNSKLFEILFKDDIQELSNIFENLANEMQKEVISKIEELQSNIIETTKENKKNTLDLIDKAEFEYYIAPFRDKIINEFISRLNDNILKNEELSSKIDIALDMLFYDNGFEYVNKSEVKSDITSTTEFFKQINIIDYKEELPKGLYPVYEHKNREILYKIKRIIEEKADSLRKNTKVLVKPLKPNKKYAFLDKFEKIFNKRGFRIYKPAIFTLIDTALFDENVNGILFCYDGIYINEFNNYKYIEYSSITELTIKKPDNAYSQLIITQKGNSKDVLRHDKINKKVLINIIEEIQNIIK